MKITPGTHPSAAVSGATPAEPSAKAATDRKLQETCREFEAIFLQTMLKGMRATLPGDALMEDSLSSDIYTDLRDLQVARSMAQNEGIGIAEALYRQLSAIEERQPASDAAPEKKE